MNLPRLIAWRYLRRPTDKLVSAVGLVSVFGLVIGVMALVISMALMTGYRGDLQRKLLGGNAEVFVYSIGGPMHDTSRVIGVIRGTRGVAEASPVLFQQALVTTERNSTGTQVMVKGFDPVRARNTPMLAKIVGPHGRFETPDGENGIAVGKYLATRLGVHAGDAISVTVPSEGESFLPRSATFVVTNVFSTGFYEYDARWLFIDLAEAERLAGAREAANLIEVKLAPGKILSVADIGKAIGPIISDLVTTGRSGHLEELREQYSSGSALIDQVTNDIGRRTDHRYAVSDWRDMNRQLFSMLKIQQLVLFIVIGLIVFVSTFNIVSTLIMTVHEKRREVGILTSMGAGQRMISRVFLWYGTMVGFTGTATGVVLGVVISWIVTRFHIVSFPPEIAEVYFVSSIPFVTRGSDLAIIAAFSMIVSFVATIIPSLRAARLNPIDALRHE